MALTLDDLERHIGRYLLKAHLFNEIKNIIYAIKESINSKSR